VYVLFYRRMDAAAVKSQQSRASLIEDCIPATSNLRLAVEEDNRVYREVSKIDFASIDWIVIMSSRPL